MIAMGKIRSDMLVFGVLLLIVIITFATASKTKRAAQLHAQTLATYDRVLVFFFAIAGGT